MYTWIKRFFRSSPGAPSIGRPLNAESLTEAVMGEEPGIMLRSFHIPELERCKEFGTRRRNRTLYDHSVRVCSVIAPILHLRLAGLLHDIGKPETVSVDGGSVHYYGHAERGAVIARDVLSRLGYDDELAAKVAHLIHNHMFQLQSFHSDRAIKRFIKKVGPENVMDLLELRRADIVGTSEGYWAAWESFNLLRERVRAELESDHL